MLLTRHDLKEMNDAINKIESELVRYNTNMSNNNPKLEFYEIDKEIELIKYKLRKAVGVE